MTSNAIEAMTSDLLKGRASAPAKNSGVIRAVLINAPVAAKKLLPRQKKQSAN
jgi:hypothetical protein